jgi:hypothetical protein
MSSGTATAGSATVDPGSENRATRTPEADRSPTHRNCMLPLRIARDPGSRPHSAGVCSRDVAPLQDQCVGAENMERGKRDGRHVRGGGARNRRPRRTRRTRPARTPKCCVSRRTRPARTPKCCAGRRTRPARTPKCCASRRTRPARTPKCCAGRRTRLYPTPKCCASRRTRPARTPKCRPTKLTSPYQGLDAASDKTREPVSRTERDPRQNSRARIKD